MMQIFNYCLECACHGVYVFASVGFSVSKITEKVTHEFP